MGRVDDSTRAKRATQRKPLKGRKGTAQRVGGERDRKGRKSRNAVAGEKKTKKRGEVEVKPGKDNTAIY